MHELILHFRAYSTQAGARYSRTSPAVAGITRLTSPGAPPLQSVQAITYRLL